MTRRFDTSVPAGMERWESSTGQLMLVHAKARCSGYCAIHNPSDTHMKSWPTYWRADRGLMERTCEHGIGHPDPDQVRFWYKIYDTNRAEAETVHGCDGCCGINYINGEIVQQHELEN